MQKIHGHYNKTENANFLIICARFNELIVQKLEQGAIDMLNRHGVKSEQITVCYVPGAFELPLIAQKAAVSKKYDAIIALGAVIKGSTAHFDVVVTEQAKGLAQVALKHDIPVLNGVLTAYSIEQALERAGTKAGNKGAEVALAALEMVSLIKEFS